MITDIQAQAPTTGRRPRGRPRRGTTDTARPDGTPRTLPRIVTVFRGVDGRLYHARCGRRVELVGIRGGIELDFRCVTCWEHVTLTEAALARVPVGQGSTP
jgi:hypothetical protein